MKKNIVSLLIAALFASLNGVFATPPPTDGEYGVVIEGYDWGPAVSNVITSYSIHYTKLYEGKQGRLPENQPRGVV